MLFLIGAMENYCFTESSRMFAHLHHVQTPQSDSSVVGASVTWVKENAQFRSIVWYPPTWWSKLRHSSSLFTRMIMLVRLFYWYDKLQNPFSLYLLLPVRVTTVIWDITRQSFIHVNSVIYTPWILDMQPIRVYTYGPFQWNVDLV